MKITKALKVEDIKKSFNQKFPHLKLELYRTAHKAGEGSAIENQVSSLTTIGNLNPNMKDGTVIFIPDMKVKDFEDLFEREFGLHIQVFRKSGELWLQTSTTDEWTLEVQEGKGARSERFLQ